MPQRVTFAKLLELGRAERFDLVRNLPGAGTHEGVAAVVSSIRPAQRFIDQLSQADLRHFARAVAVFEDSAGGFGSVTLLQHIVPKLQEDHDTTLRWIVENTRAYWYYENRPSRGKQDLADDLD